MKRMSCFFAYGAETGRNRLDIDIPWVWRCAEKEIVWRRFRAEKYGIFAVRRS